MLDVSYDVESRFTSIPVAETIEYILKRIYTNKELEPLCKKSVFKKLFIKLTKESVFSANNLLIKQIDGCPTVGLISCFLRHLYVKNERERSKNFETYILQAFYGRYVILKENVTKQIFFLMC